LLSGRMPLWSLNVCEFGTTFVSAVMVAVISAEPFVELLSSITTICSSIALIDQSARPTLLPLWSRPKPSPGFVVGCSRITEDGEGDGDDDSSSFGNISVVVGTSFCKPMNYVVRYELKNVAGPILPWARIN
jgi:hypothetical protein